MNGREIWLVFRKELLDSLRDRRTWRYSILLPLLLVPVLIVATSMGVSGQTAAQPRQPLAVSGAEHGPALVRFLEEGERFRVMEVTDVKAALAGKVARVGLAIPASFGQARTGLRVVFDSTDTRALIQREQLEAVVAGYGRQVAAAELVRLGVDPGLVNPVALQAEDLRPQVSRRVSMLALMLPMFLLLWGAVGGMHVAVDVTAAEKERGTLEALLTAPASRQSLVLGKYLAVLLAAAFSQVVSLAGFVVGFQVQALFVTAPAAGAAGLPWGSLPAIWLAGLVGAALFAAVELAVCVHARSVREAQSYQAPISFSVMIPWVVLQFMAPSDVPGYLYYLPLFNNVVLVKELLLGIARPENVAAAVLTCGALAVLVLRWAAWRFRQEGVLFRV